MHVSAYQAFMASKPNKLSRFWKELKRRKVTRVLAWYAGIAAILVGLASDLAGPLNLPDWAQRWIIMLLIIGFPLTMIIAWIFDITPEGLQKTPRLEDKSSETKGDQHSRFDTSYDGSIAVLPFQDMSPENDQEYFCDGISEEIINALTRVERLKVIARTSAFAFKGKPMDIREIGKTLNVAYVLEGSTRKDGNKLRITAQLIRVQDGSHIWSETYNRDFRDIFSIQEEISLSIVDKLKLRLRGGAKGGILKRHTENPEAYQYYLKGLYYWQMMTPEGNQKAQENYRKAIETDPDYALVYSILGSNFLFAGTLGFLPPEVAIKNAKENTETALALDKSIAVAHSTMASIHYLYNWDLVAAEKGYLKSFHLNPNTAWDRFFYAMHLAAVHRYDEAMAESLIALEKDPFNVYISTQVGLLFLKAGRVDEAINRQELTINIYPKGFLAHLHLGMALEVKGLLDDAIKSYETASVLSNGSPMAETKLACALHKDGRKKEAGEKIHRTEQMMESMYIPSSLLVPYYLLEKDLDKAYQFLEKACEEKDFGLPGLMSTPILEHQMPDDPRFTALLGNTGLHKYQNK